MQTVSSGDSLLEMSKPVSCEKKIKNKKNYFIITAENFTQHA